VDVLGLPVHVSVTTADVQDREAAKDILSKIGHKLKTIIADGGYAGKLVAWAWKVLRVHLKIIRRHGKIKGFFVIPKRWIVERSFGWMANNRRLNRDYEEYCRSSESFINLSFCSFVLNRLFPHY